MAGRGELVVLSHLRWTWVWQRPQHLVTRLARSRRTWFVEYPVPVEPDCPGGLRVEDLGNGMTRVLWLVPTRHGHVEWDDPRADGFGPALTELLGAPAGCRTAWLSTPLALGAALAIAPHVVAYDVMDDLAAFASAPEAMTAAHSEAIAAADLLVAGGRTLHASLRRAGRRDAVLAPSGVDAEHYAVARRIRAARAAGGRPVVGYVGVVDERIDLPLVAELAEALPDWDLHMVGPVAKVDRRRLPAAPNISWLGKREYADLPHLMGGFDVALLPFALNRATRSISPTKTLEYLAAGLPVVTTPVADVLADVGPHVRIVRTGAEAADACRAAAREDGAERDHAVAALLAERSWDRIAGRLDALLAGKEDAALAGSGPDRLVR